MFGCITAMHVSNDFARYAGTVPIINETIGINFTGLSVYFTLLFYFGVQDED